MFFRQKQHLTSFDFIIGLGTPAGIAVDTVTSHLYIVDSSKNRIIVCNSYGDVCVVIQESLSTPKDIVIIHKHRYVHICKLGTEIEPYNMTKKFMIIL